MPPTTFTSGAMIAPVNLYTADLCVRIAGRRAASNRLNGAVS